MKKYLLIKIETNLYLEKKNIRLNICITIFIFDNWNTNVKNDGLG